MGDDEFRVDAHVKVLDERVVERAKRRGLDAIVYAPHFEQLPDIRARAARFSDDDLVVVPAREVFTGDWRSRRHVLALGLNEPVPDFITLEGAMAEFERQDATVLVPHPCFLNVSLCYEAIQRYREQIDGIEAANSKLVGRFGERSKQVVADFGMPPFGSSYAHLRASVGEVWTAFDGDVESADDVVEAFADGRSRRVGRRTGLGHRARSLAEFSHLGFENTWKKVDRFFLQGTEPTHPRHLLYGNRFDDVAVY